MCSHFSDVPLVAAISVLLLLSGSGIEAHLERLSKELGVEIVSVDDAVHGHPVWGPKLQPRVPSDKPASGGDGGDGNGDGGDDDDAGGDGGDADQGSDSTGPVAVPVEAYVDVLKEVYRGSSARHRGCVYSDLANTIAPDMVPGLVQGHVPPSVVVPVLFNSERLASKRLAKEFVFVPPPLPDAGDGDEEVPEPTEEELEAQRVDSKAAALATTLAQLDADRSRLAEVKDAFAAAGVEVCAPLDIGAENPERVYARLLALLQPLVSGEVRALSTATPVAPAVATTLLESGHRRLSKFGPYCPVALMDSGDLVTNKEHPVLYVTKPLSPCVLPLDALPSARWSSLPIVSRCRVPASG